MEDKTILSDEEVMRSLPEGWKYDGSALRKEWKFEQFMQMPDFVIRAVQLMNEVNHHADISMDTKIKVVHISVTTHSECRVTQADIDFAQRLNSVF